MQLLAPIKHAFLVVFLVMLGEYLTQGHAHINHLIIGQRDEVSQEMLHKE